MKNYREIYFLTLAAAGQSESTHVCIFYNLIEHTPTQPLTHLLLLLHNHPITAHTTLTNYSNVICNIVPRGIYDKAHERISLRLLVVGVGLGHREDVSVLFAGGAENSVGQRELDLVVLEVAVIIYIRGEG
jgi:hypothetical protein